MFAPEFVTAVGDDSISRFDESRRRKKKNKDKAAQRQEVGGDQEVFQIHQVGACAQRLDAGEDVETQHRRHRQDNHQNDVKSDRFPS